MVHEERIKITNKEEKEGIGVRYIKVYTSKYILSERFQVLVEGSSLICIIDNK